MTNTLVGANLLGISDGARLEQLAADLLTRDGYSVDPTGVRGTDSGRDSLLERDNEKGILHCSAQSGNIGGKIHKDAKKADNYPEDFEFFIFATTAQMSGSKRDRLEEEIREEYGWRTHIWDFERLRNMLMGNSENHDLVREHLRVDPSEGFDATDDGVEQLYEEQFERLSNRAALRGDIAGEEPFVAVHIIPAESVSSPPDRIATELPDPPKFTFRPAGAQRFGDFVLTAPYQEFEDDEFSEYVYLDADGWIEAVTTRLVDDRYDAPVLSLYIDEKIVELVERILEVYEKAEILPPFYVYLSVFHADKYGISAPKTIHIEATNPRPLGDDEIKLGRSVLESYDTDIPAALRRPFYLLWNKAGWENGSLHYRKQEDGSFTWQPYSSR